MATLRQMLDVAETPESRIVLNLLDCPMGGLALDHPPNFAKLASDNRASALTKGEHLVGKKHQNDDLSWATAAHRFAISWTHIDDEGLGTGVKVEAGEKWWALGHLIKLLAGAEGDMGSIHAYGKSYKPQTARSEIYAYEAVLLKPGTVL